MKTSGCLLVGVKYLQRHPAKIALLIAAITLSLFLPLSFVRGVRMAEQHLRARAADTPLLLGAPGSPLELVFNGLYFSEPDLATIRYEDALQAGADGLALAIPIYARFQARGFPIVGTTLEYFEFRGLRVREGAPLTMLGDCVVGAAVAAELKIAPGDSLVSTPEQVFDLAGVYPLKMRVAGVLEPSGGSDDRAIFVDLKTAWIIEGLAHGHDEVPAGDEAVLETDEGNLTLNASVVQFQEVTPENLGGFHFHGDIADFPVTVAIAVPPDAKSETILLGRYVGDGLDAQLVRPDDVMSELFATVFQVRNVVVVALLAVGGMAAANAALVFLLSNRLRAREFESLANIGADRGSVRLLLAFEALFVVVTSVLVAGALLLALELILPGLLRTLTS